MPRRPVAPPKPPRRRRTPDEARDEILTAADGLIAARGPDAVGIKDVARAAGVSHPLVVHYFGTYPDLVRAVLRRRNQRLGEEVRRRLTAGDGPLAAREILATLLQTLRDPAHARLLAWASLSGQSEHLAIVKNHGLRRIADVLEARLAADAEALGRPPPSRALLDEVVLIGATAVLGYATTRALVLPAFGLPLDEASDAAFEAALSAMLRARLGASDPPG